mgnify:CR=1 FL=1
MKSWPATDASDCQAKRRPRTNERLARARRMRSVSSASTNRYRCMRASVVIRSAGTRTRRKTRKTSLNGVVFDARTTVARQRTPRIAISRQLALVAGWKALARATPNTKGESSNNRLNKNHGAMRLAHAPSTRSTATPTNQPPQLAGNKAVPEIKVRATASFSPAESR